jgi:hypothetical protein
MYKPKKPGYTNNPMNILKLLSLERLDQIDPVNVKNSTAFKLGSVAGTLPVLSVASIASFLPTSGTQLDGVFTFYDFGIVPFAAMLTSSALVGGAVAFFWAENRLRTIFTYGIAGPMIVLSLFLSGLSNLSTQILRKEASEAIKKAEKAGGKADAAAEDRDEKVAKLEAEINAIQSAYKAIGSVNSAAIPSDVTETAYNPDLAPK